MITITKPFLDRLNEGGAFWTSADGRITALRELDNQHLDNIIAMLDREAENIQKNEIHWLDEVSENPDLLEDYLEKAIERLSAAGMDRRQLQILKDVVSEDLDEASGLCLELSDLTPKEYIQSKKMYQDLKIEKKRRNNEAKERSRMAKEVLEVKKANIEILKKDKAALDDHIKALIQKQGELSCIIVEESMDVMHLKSKTPNKLEDIIRRARAFRNAY